MQTLAWRAWPFHFLLFAVLMRNPRIYTPQPLAIETTVELTDSAANHVGRVLRMKAGEPLVLFNGQGNAFQGEVHTVSKKSVVVSLENQLASDPESPCE